MRVHFLLAARTAADVDAIPGIRTGSWGNGPAIRVPRLGDYPDSEFLARLIAAGVTLPGKSGVWRIWHIIQVGLHGWQGRLLFRHLRRAALAAPTKLAGPWSCLAVQRLAPALADQWLYPHAYDKNGVDLGKVAGSTMRVPLCIAGDSPEGDAAYDYAPTDAACTADTDPGDPAPPVSVIP